MLVLLLVNWSLVIRTGHVLQCVLPHFLLPGGSCLGLWRFVWTRRSLKFLGLLNAILGPDGKTSLSFVGCAKIW